MSSEGPDRDSHDVDVLVIGAGQAGLATAYHLSKSPVDFAVIESDEQAGGSWLQRWDSLTLFTPARFSSLPGRPLPGDPDRYPGRTEIAEYLSGYASSFPVRYATRASRVERVSNRFRVDTNDGPWTASTVVVATGAFQLPAIPACASDIPSSLFQLHTSGYTNPTQIPPGRVLVVGAGNSGLQVASELASTHEIHLSVGSKQMPLPRKIFGRDIFWWLDRLGFTRAPLEKMPKWLAGDGDVLIGNSVRKAAKSASMSVHGRTTAFAGRSAQFEDGAAIDVDAVIWATGYRSDYGWLPVEAVGHNGDPLHRRGVSPVGGLFFVGLENQYSSASSLLGWVERDAGFVADRALSICRPAGSSVESS